MAMGELAFIPLRSPSEEFEGRLRGTRELRMCARLGSVTRQRTNHKKMQGQCHLHASNEHPRVPSDALSTMDELFEIYESPLVPSALERFGVLVINRHSARADVLPGNLPVGWAQ